MKLKTALEVLLFIFGMSFMGFTLWILLHASNDEAATIMFLME